MYNTKVICTYNTSDIFLETDNITDLEKDFIRNTIYRQELLDILDIEETDRNKITSKLNTEIHKLYEQLKGNLRIQECMQKAAKAFMSNDSEFGLMILFSYEYLYLTHICISELLDSGAICESKFLKLKSII
jgi:hypothetical protein